MIAFIKRNWGELAWTIFHTLMALFCIWMATTGPDPDKLFDFWSGVGLYPLFVSLGGYWVSCIFDNADQDTLEARYAEFDRVWRRRSPTVELNPTRNAERN